MNLTNAITRLVKQRDAIDVTLKTLRQLTETPTNAVKIITHLAKRKHIKRTRKKSPYNKSNPHWMQLPKNRARVIKMAKARAKLRKTS